MRRVNTYRLLRIYPIKRLAQLMYDSVKNDCDDLEHEYRDLKKDGTTLCVWVNSLGEDAYDILDRNFIKGWLFDLHLTHVSSEVTTDETEISTHPDVSMPTYRVKLKKGRPIASSSFGGFYDCGVSGACWVHYNAGTISGEDLKRGLEVLVRRMPEITKIYSNMHASYGKSIELVVGKGVSQPRPHMGKASPNPRAEAFNKSLGDRSRRVIYSEAREKVWFIHQLLGEPFQDNELPEYRGWTRLEIMVGRRLGVDGWEWLLTKLLQAFEHGYTGYLSSGNCSGKTRVDRIPCMEGVLTKTAERVFDAREDGTVFCGACGRELVPPDCPGTHRKHDYKRLDPRIPVDLTQVHRGTTKLIDDALRHPEFAGSSDLRTIYEALRGMNSLPHLAVPFWCPGVKDRFPWFAVVFDQPVYARMYLRWLKREYRVQKASPAGMASLMLYPLTRAREMWVVSPYDRRKTLRMPAVGFWKHWGNILDFAPFREHMFSRYVLLESEKRKDSAALDAQLLPF